MHLLNLCQTITNSDPQTHPAASSMGSPANCKMLPQNHPLGNRLVCPEYSKSVQDVKTYPLLTQQQIFVLCWNFHTDRQLSATMYPAPEKFTYCFSFQNESRTQLHTHDYIELAYVVKGNFKQRICEKDIIFKEGELCLIDKNCIHQDYLISQSSVVIFFGIENKMFQEMISEEVMTQKIASFLYTALLTQKEFQQYLHFRPTKPTDANFSADTDAKEELENCFSLLVEELYNARTGSAYICKGLLMRIFHILSHRYEFSLFRDQNKTMHWILFEEITDYIQKNYRTVTIQELQQHFHFQEDYFNRIIKKNTGMTYSSYVQQIRLEHAEKLLLSTDKSIDEIAELAGYHNKGFFYQIFKEKNGITPNEYRKNRI